MAKTNAGVKPTMVPSALDGLGPGVSDAWKIEREQPGVGGFEIQFVRAGLGYQHSIEGVMAKKPRESV